MYFQDSHNILSNKIKLELNSYSITIQLIKLIQNSITSYENSNLKVTSLCHICVLTF